MNSSTPGIKVIGQPRHRRMPRSPAPAHRKRRGCVLLKAIRTPKWVQRLRDRRQREMRYAKTRRGSRGMMFFLRRMTNVTMRALAEALDRSFYTAPGD